MISDLLATDVERVKKVRRKIEEKLRKDLTPEKVLAIATILDIDTGSKQ